MNIYRISDINFDEILNNNYDFAIFTCGNEDRTVHIPQILKKENIGNLSVIEFADTGKYIELNRTYFLQEWNAITHKSSLDDDSDIYEILRRIEFPKSKTLKILVDYSSMPRLWYAGILNWARYTDKFTSISIDFIYSVGDYHDLATNESILPPTIVTDIFCIPGCEGGTALFNSVAIFGIGFEGTATQTVLDKLEPDEYCVYHADLSKYPKHLETTIEKNKFLIDHAKGRYVLPLHSVERCFNHISELVTPYRERSDVTIVPMGPKPHVLASILVSMKFDEVACLHVATRNKRTKNIGVTGDYITTRIQFNECLPPTK